MKRLLYIIVFLLTCVASLPVVGQINTERVMTNSGMPDRMRYFCMGNALVVPMITRMGKILDEIIESEK